MLVYNPDDEPVVYRFAGSPSKELKPNGNTELPEAEARHVAKVFGQWGITILPEKKQQWKGVVAEAEEIYVKSTRKWAEDVIAEWWEHNRSKRDAGLQVEEPKEVTSAKAWLGKHGFLEKK